MEHIQFNRHLMLNAKEFHQRKKKWKTPIKDRYQLEYA